MVSFTVDSSSVEPARDDIDLASATPDNGQTMADTQAFLQTATACPIAVREALKLADGPVITLNGPPGIVPLDHLTSPGGFDSLSTAPAGKVFADVPFGASNRGWQAEGIP